MSQPTQDTDISSSLAPQNHLQDDKMREKSDSLEDELSVVLASIDVDCTDNRKEGHERLKFGGGDAAKPYEEIFPWVVKFTKVMRSAVGSKSYQLLERLLSVYIENVSKDVNACYTKPHRAAKLKNHIRDTLTFFHLYWCDIKERVEDHNLYLNKMSEIVGMYMDMELKASRRGKDPSLKIAGKLLAAMYIYLDNSEEYMLRVLLRTKFVMKNYSEICEPIFTKCLAHLSNCTESVTDLRYVRYLLALKLWKKIKEDPQDKKKVNELAVDKLGPRVPVMGPELLKIIANAPKCQKNGTLWLMQPNSFDLRKACDSFVKYDSKDSKCLLTEELGTLKIIDNPHSPSTQNVIESQEKTTGQIDLSIEKLMEKKQELGEQPGKTIKGVKPSSQPPPSKRTVKFKKFKPQMPKLRPGEVVFIDLTMDDDESKKGNGRKRKKKGKKKLEWLQEVKKKPKTKRKTNISKCANWVEIADAHSTKNFEDSCDEAPLNNMPISEDKISGSTETYKNIDEANEFVNRPLRVNNSCKHMRDNEMCTCNEMCGFCGLCTTLVQRNHKKEVQDLIITDLQKAVKQNAEDLVSSQSFPLEKNEMAFHYMNGKIDNESSLDAELVPTSYQDCNISSEVIDTIDYSITDVNAIADENVVTDSSSLGSSFQNIKHIKDSNVLGGKIKQDSQENMDTTEGNNERYKNMKERREFDTRPMRRIRNSCKQLRDQKTCRCDEMSGFCGRCSTLVQPNHKKEQQVQSVADLKQNSEDLVSSQSLALKNNEMVAIHYVNGKVENDLFSQHESSLDVVVQPMSYKHQRISSETMKQEVDTMDYSTTDVNIVTDSHSLGRASKKEKHITDRNVPVGKTKQEPQANTHLIEGIVAHCNVADSNDVNESMCSSGGNECNVKNGKQERQDTINDSTTHRISVCDKRMVSDSHSHDTSIKTIHYASECDVPVGTKKQITMEPTTDICAISTTVSVQQILELGSITTSSETSIQEKCSVASGRSNESRRKRNISSECKSNYFQEQKSRTRAFPARLQETASEANKTGKLSAADTSEKQAVITCCTTQGPASSNKLQQNLIHSLSLDSMMQIQANYLQYESEEDDKETENQSERTTMSNSIGSKQISDETSNSSNKHTVEPRNLGSASKNLIDEFENIDILNSILNGDMSMEDEEEILEEPQSSMLPSISHDTSASVLNFITEFIAEPQSPPPIKKDCLPNGISYLHSSKKSLPEGSLGTIGILDSLLDSDLTSKDSVPNDFMYSNVQTVDPRLIRKSPREDRIFANDFSSITELFPQEDEPSDIVNMGTKDQLFLDEKDNLNSAVNLVEFGLSADEQDTFEMPVLGGEEIIQLPQDNLMVEPVIPSSCQSPLSPHSDVVSSDVARPTSPSNECNLTDGSYTYTKMGNMKEFESLNDLMSRTSSEVDATEEVPTSLLTDFTPPHSVDSPPSPSNYTNSPALHNLISPSSPTSCNPINSTVLNSSLPQRNLTPPTTPQHDQMQTPGRSLLINRSQSKTNSQCNDRSCTQKSVVDGNTVAMLTDHPRRSSKRKTRFTKKVEAVDDVTQSEKVESQASQRWETRRMQLQVSLKKLRQRNPQTQVNVEENKSEKEHSTQHTQHTKLLNKKQLQHIDLRKFSMAAQQNKQVLINLNGKTTPAIVFKRSPENDKLLQTLQKDMSNHNNVLYKVASAINTSAARNKPYSKLPKVNVTIKNEVDVLSSTEGANVRNKSEISADVVKSPRTRWSARNVKAQAPKSVKEKSVRKIVTSSIEEPSIKKKKKMASKLLPILKNEGVIFTMNQQKMQDKHSKIIRRDYASKDKTKRNVV